MLKFLKKLLGLESNDVWAPPPAPVVEEEKVQVVEKKVKTKALPKKETPKRETKKREKPALKVVKAEAAPTKKRGRPSKKK